MLLILYFIVPLIWLILTILLTATKSTGILKWLITKTTGGDKNQIQAITKQDLHGLYAYLRNCLIIASTLTLGFAIIFCAPGVPKNKMEFVNAGFWFLIMGFLCVVSTLGKALSVGNKLLGLDGPDKKKQATYIGEGMVFGMIAGTAVGYFSGNVGVGTGTGITLGMLIGMSIPKRQKSRNSN